MKSARLLISICALLVALTLLLLLPGWYIAQSAPAAPAAPLPMPTDVYCQGWARTTVSVSWTDTAIDETEYRMERSVAGGPFSEVAVLTQRGDGYYDAYFDTGVDTSSPNRRYRLRSYRASDGSYSEYSEICNNRRIYEPGAFRIFYGLRGTDDCPVTFGQEACLTDTSSGGTNIFVNLLNTALVGSVDAFTRNGYTRRADVATGGYDKIPINVVWCDGGGCAGGSALGISPLLIEWPFTMTTRMGDPIAYMVTLHEMYHFEQYQYGGLWDSDGGWVVEAQARSIQDKFCLGSDPATALCFDDIATGYAGYVPEVRGYLGTPNWPIIHRSYGAALLWTYLTEKFGSHDPGNPLDAVEGGLDVLRRFWENSAATPGRDGINVLNATLAEMGFSQRFRDIWKDFAVANYAKDIRGAGVPAKYQYADMAQPGGDYGPVALALDSPLALGDALVRTDNSVYNWGSNYYQVRPDSNVPVIDIKFTQDSSVNVYYTILGLRGDDLAYEYNVEARNLSRTLVNDGFTRVVVIVAGLENPANYRLAFNGTQPSLQILSPTSATQAHVGDPASPDKFLVTLELLAGDGTPLDGVDLSSFSFQVGAVAVPTTSILTSARIMGQYWFLLRAPIQPAANQYDLTARYGHVLTGTQTLAVDYTPRNNMDNMLMIDRSGSMIGAKVSAAKTAAHLFIDSWRVGDNIGMLSFNETGFPPNTVDMALTGWNDQPAGGTRQVAFDRIDAISAGGGTNLGDALRAAWKALDPAQGGTGDSSHDWAIVLLSDGKEEASSPVESFDTVINALRWTSGKRPAVYSVAIGPDADRPRMQYLANVTGGSYQYVSSPGVMASTRGPTAPLASFPLEMDKRFHMIATKIAAQQQFFSLEGPQADHNPWSDLVTIPVEGGSTEIVLSLSWDSASGSIDLIELTDPNGASVAAYETDSQHSVWRVASPMAGDWKLLLGTGTIGKTFNTIYLVQASLRSPVTLETYLTNPDDDRTTGAAIGILASLTDSGPILHADVVAWIENPAGNVVPFLLYDDGDHNDGAAMDGLYGDLFHQTGLDGSYNIRVDVSGRSPLAGGPFSRQELLSFHLDGGGDDDKDGLSNNWEIRFGTDPQVSDAAADPDHDAATNSQEQSYGTDPHNPDSDGGGEADGTDVNPLNPADDRLEADWVRAYPGDGQAFVRYHLLPEYEQVEIYRGLSASGPFTLTSVLNPGSGIFTDTKITNDTPVCYISVVISGMARSANQPPSCTTPRRDPLAPHGSLQINHGATATFSPAVTLTLWASDEPLGDESLPSDISFPPPPNSASGVSEMMISNESAMPLAAWQPYQTSLPWTLAQTSGLANVFVKYRDQAGNESAVFPATIYVGTNSPGFTHHYLPWISK